MTDSSREVRLARRPTGTPVPDDFALVEVAVEPPGAGQVTVENLYVSVDPYMRGRMNDVPSYVPPFALDRAMTGGAVGVVRASRSDQVPEGTLVLSQYGWRERFTTDSGKVQVLPPPPGEVSPSAYLGVLGMPGFTAWVGVTDIAAVREADVVFVSAAAGAVGSLAGQFARLRGASLVVGSAGSAAKVAALAGLGFDAGFSHRDHDAARHLREAAPDGIDVYFDNVGGEQLRAAIATLRPFGRVALCGSISSGYGGQPAEPIDNLALAVGKRLTLRGFIVSDSADRQEAFLAEVGPLLAAGKLVVPETVVDGIENAAGALVGLFTGGEQVGKVVVRIG